jgi:alkylation response protein AidB-like acyl-CoA dehydrogenase
MEVATKADIKPTLPTQPSEPHSKLDFFPPDSADAIKKNAQILAQDINARDLSSEFDEIRKIPEDIFQKLRDAGIFRMNMPKIWGGPELTPMDQVEIIETLSKSDASVGWCAFIWCDSGTYSGYLEDTVARKLYPSIDTAQSGWVYPVGRGDKVDGGYILTGHYKFGSGVNLCNRLAAGFTAFENGEPILTPAGRPEWRVAIGSPDQFEIFDNWHTMGLRGTGSNDYHAHSIFIPTEHTFSFYEKAPREGSIWKKPSHFLRKMSGVPLGTAREAIDLAIDALSDKSDMFSGQAYVDSDSKQLAIASAEGKLGAARAYVFEALNREWEKLEAGLPLTEKDRTAVIISRQQAFQMGREVSQMMLDLVGGSAIHKQNKIERCVRDMNTACQHLVGQERMLQFAGKLLFGSEEAKADVLL